MEQLFVPKVWLMATRKGVVEHRTQVVREVSGGWVKRDANSGEFLEVQGSSGRFKGLPKSKATVSAASAKRREALKRLAER
jgi:hypothetical protein